MDYKSVYMYLNNEDSFLETISLLTNKYNWVPFIVLHDSRSIFSGSLLFFLNRAQSVAYIKFKSNKCMLN